MKESDAVGRSILSAASFIREMTLSEDHASRPGFLQALDERIKAVSFLAMAVAVSFTADTVSIWAVYFLCVILAAASRLGIGFFLLRTWVFIPLFSLFVIGPSIFSFVTPGETAAVFPFMGRTWTITRPGLGGAALFVARVATAVSLVVLLSLTTRHERLLKALRVLGVPKVFVMTLSMTYRYLYACAITVEHIFLAVKSRVGSISGRRKGSRIAAWNLAGLLGRSMKMNEEVYRAMLSRGYTGEPLAEAGRRVTAKDLVWLAAAGAVCAGLLWRT